MTYQAITSKPSVDKIFCFGSNEAGVHGAGAAKFALEHKGAIWGQGVGLQGQSYAIPTKDENIQTLPLKYIRVYVNQFIQFAKDHPELTFELTPIGCGLAGYKPADIAPMFEFAPDNVLFPESFLEVLDARRDLHK